MRTVVAALAVLVLVSGCSTTGRTWAQACPTNMRAAPGPGGEGVVANVLDHNAAMALLGQTEAELGVPIDRAYLNNTRVAIQMADGKRTTALLPYEIKAAVGDRVVFQSNYRSPDLPCAYVPNLVTRKL